MPLSVDSLLRSLGGAEQAAQLLGVGTEALRKWRQAGSIPPRHWQRIMAATGLPLTQLPGPRADPAPEAEDAPPLGATAALVLGDGSVFWGLGFGASGATAVGELCFNTGMTGYQETLTDPSYAAQIIVFTFPHIGNVGTNPDDLEAGEVAARGLVLREEVGDPANWRSTQHLGAWLRARRVVGISGVDTRALTARIRDGGPPSAIIAYPPDGRFDLSRLRAEVGEWPGLAGMDLAGEVSCTQTYAWDQTRWSWDGGGYGVQTSARRHVVAVDYGAKRNILRSLVSVGCRVTVVPAASSADDILRHAPDGVFLSNGPGDPAATAAYAVPAIRGVLAAGLPIFGICLGHQLLALALGARTYKLDRGHRGANQPVQELHSGRVEITSQNHGFAVDGESLPDGVSATHVSLFDGSNEGLACRERPVFSVQYHPEASPGPNDSGHLFSRFVAMMERGQ